MKWFNKDKSRMINLDKISHYSYIPIDKYSGNQPYIWLTVDGSNVSLVADEAKEVYDLIIKNGQ